MSKIWLGIVVVAALLFCSAGQVMAVGFGAYLEGARGDGEFQFDYSPEFDVDAETRAFGFVLDTDLTDRGVFNYRLNVGYEALDLDDNTGDTLELEGLVVANTFGFGIIRKPDFRWWLGPQIRVGLYNGEAQSDSLTDYDLVSFGYGAVTGINVMAGNTCVSTSLGVLTTVYAGETDGPGFNENFDADVTTVFVNLSVLFGN